MKKVFLAVVTTLTLAPVLARVLAAAPFDERKAFLLAVLTRDGYAIPFASFDGRRWKSPWPEDRAVEMPISIDNVDKDWWGIGRRPERMTLWSSGAKIGEVALTQLAMIKSLCSTRLAIKTDYKPREFAPPRLRAPYPKDGLLVAGDIAVEKIDIVEPGSAEWNRTLIVITDKFNKVETAAARSYMAWRHPFNDRQRRAQPITIEAVYRAPNEKKGWTTYFVEALRQYPARPADRGCGVATTGHAWVHIGPGEEVKVEVSAQITYCDRKGVAFMLPFGLIRTGDHIAWVFQSSGFEWESYRVVDPHTDEIRPLAALFAGGCPEP
jgi:hypothetical protein